jgi:hypothetical protein
MYCRGANKDLEPYRWASMAVNQPSTATSTVAIRNDRSTSTPAVPFAQRPVVRRRLGERVKSTPERSFAVGPMTRGVHPVADLGGARQLRPERSPLKQAILTWFANGGA